MKDAILDKETHTYTVDGHARDGVSTVLRNTGMVETRWWNEEARQRGTDVHLAIELYDRGVLDWDLIDAEWLPYIEAYQQFHVDYPRGVEILEIERSIGNGEYAGTPDRLVRMMTTPGSQRRRCDLELKTGGPVHWHGLQAAAYALLWGRGCAAAILYLAKTGRYRLEWTTPQDSLDWYACLQLYRRKLGNHHGS